MAEGWAWPMLAKKAHYFRDGRSICGRWLFAGDPTQNQNMSRSPDDCAACWKLLDKHPPSGGEERKT
jgi:hypothetical protein